MLDCLLEPGVSDLDTLRDTYDTWHYYSADCNPSLDECECLSFENWLDLYTKEILD